MANYTANAYATRNVQGDKKAIGSGAGKYGYKDPNQGQKSKKVLVNVGTQISGGEIWVNEDTVLAASDTLTITVVAV